MAKLSVACPLNGVYPLLYLHQKPSVVDSHTSASPSHLSVLWGSASPLGVYGHCSILGSKDEVESEMGRMLVQLGVNAVGQGGEHGGSGVGRGEKAFPKDLSVTAPSGLLWPSLMEQLLDHLSLCIYLSSGWAYTQTLYSG